MNDQISNTKYQISAAAMVQATAAADFGLVFGIWHLVIA
jgi:hypothetical protein